MQDEEKKFSLDGYQQRDVEYIKKIFPIIMQQTVNTQTQFYNSLPENIDIVYLFKTLDTNNFHLESSELIDSLFLCAKVVGKPFPFNIFLLEWNNKKAQTYFVIYLLDNKIDLDGAVCLTKVIKSDYIIDSVYYLNSIELFKCIAGLNNRNLIMRIKQECPEMCVLGLSHVLPKFNDIFDDLFLKTIDKYRQLNSIYASEKSHSSKYSDCKSAFYSYQENENKSQNGLFTAPSSLVLQSHKNEMKILEKQFYILNILFIQKKVISKLSLIPLDIALNLIVENNCLEQVFSLNSELSYNVLIAGAVEGLFDLRMVLAFRAKNDTFMQNFLVYLSGKPIYTIILAMDALLPLAQGLKAESQGLFTKLKEKVDNYYLFQPLSAVSFSTAPEDDHASYIEIDSDSAKNLDLIHPRHINKYVQQFTPELIEKIENDLNCLFSYKSKVIDKNLEPFKNIPKLKRLYNGSIHQKNFVNKIATYFINNLDPFIEEMYEEGLLCQNQSMMAATIIAYFKAKNRSEGVLTLNNLKKIGKRLFFEQCVPELVKPSEEKFHSGKETFEFDTMFKYLINYKIIDDWLSVIHYFNKHNDSDFKKYFISSCFEAIKENIYKQQENANSKPFISSDININDQTIRWFINLGIILSQLTFRQHRTFEYFMFDLKSSVQKAIKCNYVEMVYFTIYFLLNSKDSIFTCKLAYIRAILIEIYDIKCELPYIKVNTKTAIVYSETTVKENNLESLFEIQQRFLPLNEKFNEKYNLIKILMDYYQFNYIKIRSTPKSEYLANYILPNNQYSSIILMAIDVSVRDICKLLVTRTIELVERTVSEIQKIHSLKGVNNLFINLACKLIHFNAHEPLFSCIKNNIINFLKMCNLDVNKVSVSQIAEANINICIDLLKREIFTRICTNSYTKEKIIVDGKLSVNVPILMSVNQLEQINIKELRGEDLEKIKVKLTGITRDIPNTKLYNLTEQWKNLVLALEKYEAQSFIDTLDEIYIEEKISQLENNECKEIKESLKDLNLKNKGGKDKSEIKEHKITHFSNLKAVLDLLMNESFSLLNLIKNSDQTDSLSETLCRHILGYLQHHNSKFLYMFLKEIFKISLPSYQHVKHYLLYTNQPFSKLIYHAIEHRIIPILEFDQLNACDTAQCFVKVSEDEFDKLRAVINMLVLRNKKICTIYDFVYTLERIARHSTISFIDHMVVSLKSYNISETANIFQEFIRNNIFSFYKKVDFLEFVLKNKKIAPNNEAESSDPKFKEHFNFNYGEDFEISYKEIYNAINLSWDHFLINKGKPSNFLYLKIDTLIENIGSKLPLIMVLKDLVEHSFVFDNFLLFKFLNRAIFKLFSSFESTIFIDETKPATIFLNGLIGIPQYILHIFYFAPRTPKYIYKILENLNLNQELLLYTISYFTENFLHCTNKKNCELNLEVTKSESETEYSFIKENDGKYFSKEKFLAKSRLVLSSNYVYIKAKRGNVILCDCKHCKLLNFENPLLKNESNTDEHIFQAQQPDDAININEVLPLGCKKYFALFSYWTNPKYPELKNIFMTTYLPNNDSLRKLDYFKIRNLLNKKISPWAYRKYRGYITAVVDSLGNNYFGEIENIIKERYRLDELINCLEMRVWCYNAPQCLVEALQIVYSSCKE